MKAKGLASSFIFEDFESWVLSDWVIGKSMDTPSVMGPELVYGASITGSLYAFISITIDAYERLVLLQRILSGNPKTKPLLGNNHSEYRTRSTHRSIPYSHESLETDAHSMYPTNTTNVIDGILLSSFMELNLHEQDEILKCWNELWKEERPLNPATDLGDCDVVQMKRLIHFLNQR